MQAPLRLTESCPLGHAFHLGDATFTRLQRRLDATERSYQRALRELERLQSAPQAPAPEPPTH